jgi:hypothetical protein
MKQNVKIQDLIIITLGLKKLEVAMEHAAVEDYVKIPKQEYNLLKEVYRTVKRQAFLVRIDEAERNLAAGKTKSMTVDDIIASGDLRLIG